jgi:hypothetical protein
MFQSSPTCQGLKQKGGSGVRRRGEGRERERYGLAFNGENIVKYFCS